MKFSVKQVLQEVKDIRSGRMDKFDSEVYETWSNFAVSWLEEIDIDEGFVGFNDRSPEIIVLDFHYNNHLKRPLSEKKIAEYEKIHSDLQD